MCELRKRIFVEAIVIGMLSLGIVASRAPAEERLARIAANVRANEDLYRNIDFAYDMQYRHANPADSAPHHLRSISHTARVVLQDALIYFKSDAKEVPVKGHVRDVSTLQGYDGKVTRIVEQNSFGNLHHERFEDSRILYPHFILFEHWHLPFQRLSEFLTAKETPDSALVWAVLGEKRFQDLRCVVVRCDAYIKESPRSATPLWRADIWLAPERNYLPVKSQSFRTWSQRFNAETPVGVGTVDRLKQIEPGIWFPMGSRITAYNIESVYESSEPVVQNEREFRIDSVSLNPSHPVRLFRDISFPPGIVVYEIQNKKIVKKTHTPGEYQGPRYDAEPEGWGIRPWIAMGTIVVGALIVGAYLRARRRRRVIGN